MFRNAAKVEKNSTGPPVAIASPMLAFLKNIGIDPGQIQREFAEAKEWLIKGLTHFKQRFDTLETLNRQAVEDVARYNARIDAIEQQMIENHRVLTGLCHAMLDTLRQIPGLPPDQTWTTEDLEKNLLPLPAVEGKEDGRT